MGVSSSAVTPRAFDTDALRSKIVRGDLIPRSFETGQFISGDSSGSTVSVVAALGSKEPSGTALNVSVPAGQNGARFQFPFFGRALGIRFRRTNYSGVQSPAEFSVRIDGVAYAVSTDQTKARVHGQTMEDYTCNVLISDDLSESDHLAEVTCVAPASGTDSIFFHGYLVERRAGYAPSRDTDALLTNGNTPTVAASVYDCLASTIGTNGVGRRVSKIRWQNNTGGAVTDLVIKYNSIIYAQPSSIASKDAYEITFNPPVVMNSLWTHVSSAGGSTLPYFVFGSY